MTTKTDIAKALGVSRTCVSLVLSKQPNTRISEATRQRVLQAAREMNFVEKSQAASPVQNHQIAYVLCFPMRDELIRATWHFALLHDLQQHAATQERTIHFIAATDAHKGHRDALGSLDLLKPAGVVLDGIIPPRLVRELLKRKIPFVITGVTEYAFGPQWQGKVSTVAVDVANCLEPLVGELARRDATTIGLIVGSPAFMVNKLLIESYKKALAKYKLPYDPARIQIAEQSSGTDVIARYQELDVHIDGLICDMAFAQAAMLHLHVMPMPGLDLNRIATYGSLELTPTNMRHLPSVGANVSTFAAAAYELLMKLINYGQHKQQHMLLPMQTHHVS